MKNRKLQNLMNFEGSEVVNEELSVIKGGQDDSSTGGSSWMRTDLGNGYHVVNDLDLDGNRSNPGN